MNSSADIVILKDNFDGPLAAGRVEGSLCSTGQQRLITDADGVVGIDHGALRFGYPEEAGWGREALAYGPFKRENGLVFWTNILNGHHGSQAGAPRKPSFRHLARRLLGSIGFRIGVGEAPPNPKGLTLDPPLKENLVVGWYSERNPVTPLTGGHGFVVHAAGPTNGDLWTTSDEAPRSVKKGIQNVPLWLMVMLRERGAMYYCATLPGVGRETSLPCLRPVSLDLRATEDQLFAVISQSVLGEIGFRVDTRVYETGVGRWPGADAWYGTAHAAHRFQQSCPQNGQAAETGGDWQVSSFSGDTAMIGWLFPREVSGLIHLELNGDSPCSLFWRRQSDHTYLCVRFDGAAVRLEQVTEGRLTMLAQQEKANEKAYRGLTVVDDGGLVQIFLDEELVIEREVETENEEIPGVGVQWRIDGSIPLSFEAHPRMIHVPADLRGQAPWIPGKDYTCQVDRFEPGSGELGADSKIASPWNWRKELGRGVFEYVAEGGVRVVASREKPNPGRTAYTIAWEDAQYADVEVEITPPGTGRGEGERGRGGLIFWQDDRNYLVINTWLDDQFQGASVSSFPFLQGREDLYRAVWTNVGKRIRWGVPYRMRAVFDGMRYLVYVDDEPVLYRALSDIYPKTPRLAIRRVGMAANWEWGNDTGSRFASFTVRQPVHMN